MKTRGMSVRLPITQQEEFRKRAEQLGKSRSSLVQEFITAFLEGRLTIREDSGIKKAKLELYK